MDTVFQNVSCVFVYLDDILITSETARLWHKDCVSATQQLRIDYSLRETHIWRQIYQFLGASNHCEGLIPLPSKFYAITHHPEPHNVRAFQELLGIINFYHRFIPNAAT